MSFQLDQPDPVRALQELATTLVCAVIEPAGPGVLRAHIVAVGDSSAWVLTGGEFIEVLGGKTTLDGGLASSAVTALPRQPEHLAPTVFDFLDNAVLLIGTDGIGDPLGNGTAASEICSATCWTPVSALADRVRHMRWTSAGKPSTTTAP